MLKSPKTKKKVFCAYSELESFFLLASEALKFFFPFSNLEKKLALPGGGFSPSKDFLTLPLLILEDRESIW